MPTIASTILIKPSDLDEYEFVGPTRHGRVVRVDMVAGLMQVTATPAPPPYALAWFVPNVPLSALTQLLNELLPFVSSALAGASIAQVEPGDCRLNLSPDAQAIMTQASDTVNRFYLRWTGRPMSSLRKSRCTRCSRAIYSGRVKFESRWFDANDEITCGGLAHIPYPAGHPDNPRRYIPEHDLSLSQVGPGWAGTCSCSGWRGDSGSWEDLALAHYLHAEAPAPGAPFEV